MKPCCKRRGRKPGCIHPGEKTLCADGQSLCFIPITLTDAAGIWKPCASAKVHVEIDGPATLQALGSAATQADENLTHYYILNFLDFLNTF